MARLLAPCLLAIAAAAFAQDDFSFDPSQFEKKPFEFGGYAELWAERFRLNSGAALYELNFFDRDPVADFNRGTGTLQLEGLYRQGIGSLRFVGFGSYVDDYRGRDHDARIYEATLTLSPSERTSLDLGKKTLRWGKGYAFNPVGFVERAKDPNDPELSREGFVLAAGNFIRSFDRPLKTVAFTPLVIPTSDEVNADFGAGRHVNFAAKLTLLYRDTDIDFLVLGEGARSARYGIDFARNVTSNFEIHGEWAYLSEVDKPVLDAAGNLARMSGSARSYLLGLRYLSESEVTTIFEYYENGAGYTEGELRDYFSFVHSAHDRFLATGDRTLLAQAASVASAYARQAPGRRYVYLRSGWKEPFDILYFTPSVTVIANLDDGSRSVSPELVYTRITNLELRFRVFLLSGDRLTEFGEKQNDRRFELRARYYF